MPRPKSSNPVRNISVGLPATTHAKIEKFNPRNRSAFFNQAVLEWMRQHDPETKQRALDFADACADPNQAIHMLTNRQLCHMMRLRIQTMCGDDDWPSISSPIISVPTALLLMRYGSEAMRWSRTASNFPGTLRGHFCPSVA